MRDSQRDAERQRKAKKRAELPTINSPLPLLPPISTSDDLKQKPTRFLSNPSSSNLNRQRQNTFEHSSTTYKTYKPSPPPLPVPSLFNPNDREAETASAVRQRALLAIYSTNLPPVAPEVARNSSKQPRTPQEPGTPVAARCAGRANAEIMHAL